MQQVGLAALVGGAIALDEPAAGRDLEAERGVATCADLDRREPALDHGLLLDVTAAPPAQSFHCREGAQQQQAEARVRADLERQREGVLAAHQALAIPAHESFRRCPRQQGCELGRARLEVIDDGDDVGVACLHLAPHASQARGTALQVGNADDVVEGHPEGKKARGLARRRVAVYVGRVAGSLGREDTTQALEIEPCVGVVLVVLEAGEAQRKDVVQVGGEAGEGRTGVGVAARCDGLDSGVRRCVHRLPFLAQRSDLLEGGDKPALARLGATLRAADRLLVGVSLERQDSARRDRAEQHGADHRAGVARHRDHVEGLGLAARLAHDAQQVAFDEAPVAELHLLGDGEAAIGRGQDVSAIGGRHAVADLAHRLEQFRRGEQVERARHRVETEHRSLAAQIAVGHEKHLDVVGGRTGALGDAGDRGALHAVAGARRGFH